MELILISDSKLKITLTPDDLALYELDCNTIDYDKTETRQALREIFEQVKDMTGFDAAGDRLFIQLYPSRAGGCEMYVTKLGTVCAEGRERESEPMRALPHPRGERHSAVAPTLLPVSGERERTGAYRFECLRDLISVCRHLASRGYGAYSAAYRDERDRYFLLLRERASVFGVPEREFSFITEFGTPENFETLRLYISEHASPICEENAVATLAAF